ncbi:MAG: amidase [Proteobacteria bacterium]|nr:amidase [Pseudomonadota bacterium]
MQTTNYVADPGRIADLARRIREGELSPADLVRGCLDRMKVTEPVVEAWREVCADTVLAEAEQRAKEVEDGLVRGPLHGIPVGIKDIIDVAGVPTRCNSLSRADAAPATADAEIVSALRAAGAVILGKTHTTEFAYFDPSPARNPHDIEHTPGGSSSGSAAAVASGTVPAALGTQTMASLNRPAAYCGIAAFKPSTQLLSTFGIEPLSTLYDTVGFYGWSVADAVAIFDTVCPAHARLGREELRDGPLTVVVLQDPFIDEADEDVKQAVDRVAGCVADAGHSVESRDTNLSFAHLYDLQVLTMEYEIGRIQRRLLDEPEGRVGAKLSETIRRGSKIDDAAYLDGRRALDDARSKFFGALEGVDAFLWPATPKTAPRGIAWTGEPKFISPWTALGGPVVTMPAGAGADGLPIGCLVTGAPGSDFRFGRIACRIAEAAEAHGTAS